MTRRLRFLKDRVEVRLTIRDKRPVRVWSVFKRAANDVLRLLDYNALPAAERRAADLKRERDARYRAKRARASR